MITNHEFTSKQITILNACLLERVCKLENITHRSDIQEKTLIELYALLNVFRIG